MSELRIIVTGGRKRSSEQDRATLLRDITRRVYSMPVRFGEELRVVVVQGGCPDGVDAMARDVTDGTFFQVETYPADFDIHPNNAVEVSNQAMVDGGADLCIAMPNALADGPSLGTWDMICRAVDAGIETRIYPDVGHAKQ